MKAIEVLEKLFEARDQAHAMHLVTKSYAEHKALQEFYENWLDLTDSFFETWQGKYGRVSGKMVFDVDCGIEPAEYISGLMPFLNLHIGSVIQQGVDTDLENIIADMKQLVNHTGYLLTLK